MLTQKQKDKEKLKKERLKFREATQKEKKTRKRQFSRSALIKEADRVFSLYIRDRDAGAPCITCGAPWQENFQAGHFMSRKHYHTRWIEKNCHGQCPKCNLWGAGEQYAHGVYIDRTYGVNTAIQIQKIASYTFKIPDHDLINTILHYYGRCFDM